MTPYVLGIDPGISGGVAVLNLHGAVIKTIPFSKVETILPFLLLNQKQINRSYIEQVHAFPKQGVCGVFTFGQNYGWWLGTLGALQFPVVKVYPLKWQTALRCRTGGNKNISKAAAQKLFPHIKVTHQIADCLLIAEYGRRLATGENDL